MLRRLALLLAVAAVAACGSSPAGTGEAISNGGGGSAGDHRLGHDLAVMTRNLYVGADIFEPFLSTSPLETAAKVFDEVLASDPAARMAAVADEIDAVRPDLVGLQEAFRLVVTPLASDQPVLLDLDFLAALEGALAERPRPLHYTRVAERVHTLLTIPFFDRGVKVTVIDRDAILAHADVHVETSFAANFDADFTVTLAGVPVEQKRGWVEVVAKHHGDTFTFANTHLEVKEFPPMQSLQAQELLARFGGSGPTILVGDFNSSPDDPPVTIPTPGGPVTFPTPYQILASAFRDAWSETRSAEGFTCCFDADLTPPSRDLFERVDLVWFRGDLRALRAFRVGLEPLEALGGRWPSDHAGVVAVLRTRHADR
jgi:endonuclease/exonuclease/phosphatase family metal-dependent hydrolase